VTLFRGIDGPSSSTGEPGLRATPAHEEKRLAIRSTRLAAGTLACGRCDAPIALGADPVSITTQLMCPYCRHRGPVREFLSLAAPTRPARVVVRVGTPARQPVR
jgi:hypothetical protein